MRTRTPASRYAAYRRRIEAFQQPTPQSSQAENTETESLSWTKRGSLASIWGAGLTAAGVVVGIVAFLLAYTAFLHDEKVRRSTLVANAWTLLNSNLQEAANRGQADAASILLTNGISLAGLKAGRANLQRMDIDVAYRRPNFAYADLCGANLRGSNLGNASFEGTVFGPWADLTEIQSRDANFFGAYLQRAQLTDSHFTGARFWRADLRGALAANIDFRGAEFYYADMRNMAFWYRTIPAPPGSDGISQPTDLTGAQFYGADLRGTSLEHTIGLTTEALAGACIDATTKLPVGVVPPSKPCELEVPAGSLTTRHAIAIFGEDSGQQYLQRVKACGFADAELPPALRKDHPGFTIQVSSE